MYIYQHSPSPWCRDANHFPARSGAHSHECSRLHISKTQNQDSSTTNRSRKPKRSTSLHHRRQLQVHCDGVDCCCWCFRCPNHFRCRCRTIERDRVQCCGDCGVVPFSLKQKKTLLRSLDTNEPPDGEGLKDGDAAVPSDKASARDFVYLVCILHVRQRKLRRGNFADRNGQDKSKRARAFGGDILFLSYSMCGVWSRRENVPLFGFTFWYCDVWQKKRGQCFGAFCFHFRCDRKIFCLRPNFVFVQIYIFKNQHAVAQWIFTTKRRFSNLLINWSRLVWRVRRRRRRRRVGSSSWWSWDDYYVCAISGSSLMWARRQNVNALWRDD